MIEFPFNRRFYFDRQGKPIGYVEWSNKLADLNYRIVKQESFDRWFISTIWTGVNSFFYSDDNPVIFETMIFVQDENLQESDPLHNYQERCSTEEEAFQEHENALSTCRGVLLIEQRAKELSQAEESAKGSQSEDPDQLT